MAYDTVAQFRDKRDEAVAYIKSGTNFQPEYLLIRDNGFDLLLDEIEQVHQICYSEIPHFPVSDPDKSGKLLFGKLGGKNLVVMHGGFHYFEGFSMQQIAFPVRVAKTLGAQTLINCNSSGGLNPHFCRGDIMLITDHINFMGDNPLIGPNDEKLGPRFPDMSEPYTERLLELAENVALEHSIKLQKGVYMAVTGPMLETEAEYRYLRNLGADAVGMSAVPEVIAAVHMGLDVLGLSAITDECFPNASESMNEELIQEAVAMAEPLMNQIIISVLERL